MPRLRVLCFVFAYAAALLVCAGMWTPAGAEPSFFSSRCASCHTDDSVTCDGCHNHRGSLSASADQAEYFPGDPVTIHFNGGQEHGWIRALLYDHTGAEIDRASGPTGTGDDGLGSPVVFPVSLHGTAPMEAGAYTWQTTWFGNSNDGGPNHGESPRVNVVIHVVSNPAAAPDPEPNFLYRSWGRIKEYFR